MMDKKDEHNPSTKAKSSKSTKDSSTKEKLKEKSNTDIDAGSTAKAKPPEPSKASTTPTPTVPAKAKPTDRGSDSNTLEYTHTESQKHTGDKPTHSPDDSSTTSMPTEAASSSSRTSNDRLGSKRKAQATDGNCHPTKIQAMGTGTLPDPSNAGDWVLKALQSIFPNGVIPSMKGPVAGNISSPQQQTQAPVASPPPPSGP